MEGGAASAPNGQAAGDVGAPNAASKPAGAPPPGAPGGAGGSGGFGPHATGPRLRPDFVAIEGNPGPLDARVVWYHGKGPAIGRSLDLRMLYAPEPKGGKGARGTVLVCPGRTEFIEKYFEVGRELQDRHFAVAIFDWPGQGLSSRMHKNALAGHVRNFSVYVDALQRGLDQLHKLNAPKPYILLGHSMGGAIALEALRRRKVPVAAAAFSSPMWGLPVWFFQRWYAHAMRFLGFGGRVIKSSGPPETFENNILTHDERRWSVYRRLVEAEPQLAVTDPTIAWVCSALNVIQAFSLKDALHHLRDMPSMVAIAGAEKIVKPSAQHKVAKAFKHAEVFTVKGASHEILMETDDRRAEFWEHFDRMCRKAHL